MHIPPTRSLSFLLVVTLLAGIGTRADASPYYEVLDTGELSPQEYMKLHTEPLPGLTDAQRADLPGIWGYQGLSPMIHRFFPMHPTSGINSAGTVLGVVPNGHSLGIPYSSTAKGYAQLQPDGHFGGFAQVSSDENGLETRLFLNARNEILVSGSHQDQWGIIDLNAGTTTPFTSILSPEVVAKYGPFLRPNGIADNGAILTEYVDRSSGTARSGFLILAPPGLTQPVPAPEPATLVTLALGFAGLVVRRSRAHQPDRSEAVMIRFTCPGAIPTSAPSRLQRPSNFRLSRQLS